MQTSHQLKPNHYEPRHENRICPPCLASLDQCVGGGDWLVVGLSRVTAFGYAPLASDALVIGDFLDEHSTCQR